MGIVKSRVFYIDNKPCLVPGIDSFTFDPFSSSEPYSTSAGIFGGKVIKITADRNYQVNEEMMVSFGLKSSAECCEDHGIVPLVDLLDACAEITIAIENTDVYNQDKENILENAGYGIKQRFDLEASVDLDPGLLQMLRLKFIEGMYSLRCCSLLLYICV
jgi:hypothetical protein